MHPVTLLQNTPIEEIKHFCEVNNYALNITGTGDLILVHEAPEVKPTRTVKYVTMNVDKADIASIENRVRHAFNQGYDLGFKDGKERAKPQEPILDKIFCIVHPISIMSTPELEHKAIMQIAEMLEPLCLPESEG